MGNILVKWWSPNVEVGEEENDPPEEDDSDSDSDSPQPSPSPPPPPPPHVPGPKDVELPNVELHFICSNGNEILNSSSINSDKIPILTGFYHDLIPGNLDVDITSWTQQTSSTSGNGMDDNNAAEVWITSTNGVTTLSDSDSQVLDSRRIRSLVTPPRLQKYFEAICDDIQLLPDGTSITPGPPVIPPPPPPPVAATTNAAATILASGQPSPLAIDNMTAAGATLLVVFLLFCIIPAILVCVCSGDLPRRIQRAMRPQLYVKGLKLIEDDSESTKDRLEIICRSGVKYRSAEIGCYALDETDYSETSPVFPLFEYVTTEYHKIPSKRGFKVDMPPTGIHSQLDWGDWTAHKLPTAEDFIGFSWRFSQGILSKEPGRFQSVRVSICRNLAGYPFPAGLTQERRTEIVKMIKAALRLDTGSPSSSRRNSNASSNSSSNKQKYGGGGGGGSSELHTTSGGGGDDDVENKDLVPPSTTSSSLLSNRSTESADDQCPWIFEDFSKRQDLWPIDKFRELRAAGIAQQWPLNRFVATKQCENNGYSGGKSAADAAAYDEEKAQLLKSSNNQPSFVQIMVNGEDHIKIVVSNPNQLSSADDVIRTVSELARAEKLLADKLREVAPHLYEGHKSVYAYNNHFGYLTSSPANLGSTFQITVIDGLDIRESKIQLYKPVLETIEDFFHDGDK